MSDPEGYLDSMSEAAQMLGSWEPEVAMEAVRMYAGMPGMLEDMAGGISTVAEYAEEVRDIFRADHAEKLEALENPEPADAYWDPAANRDYL